MVFVEMEEDVKYNGYIEQRTPSSDYHS